MRLILGTGNTVVKAVDVLKANGVDEENIIVLNLFSTPNGKSTTSLGEVTMSTRPVNINNILVVSGIQAITEAFPALKVLTSETDPIAPKHFGQKYFGTD